MLNHVKNGKNVGFVDSPGIKYSRGELVSHSVLWAGMLGADPITELRKILE